MFTYQHDQHYFARVSEGLEEPAAKELRELGARETTTRYRGVLFEATPADLLRIVYGTRLCSRVLVPLLSFDCHSDRYLYKTARGFDWPAFLSVDDTFAVSATLANSRLNHSQYAALKVKDAIVDTFRDRTGRRPNVERRDPDALFHLHVEHNHATLSLDAGGGALHRRGYRAGGHEAPMQETVAAALVQLSGWDCEKQPFIDPMCGSGTVLCEAFMSACRIPAGYFRKRFGFERLPDFDRKLWRTVKAEMDSRIRELPGGLISGGDIAEEAVLAARENLQKLPGGSRVRVSRRAFQEITDLSGHYIVSNPPYGVRLGESAQAKALLGEFGSFLKHRCRGATACLYFGDRELIKHIGLRPSLKKNLKHGGLDGVLACYAMY